MRTVAVSLDGSDAPARGLCEALGFDAHCPDDGAAADGSLAAGSTGRPAVVGGWQGASGLGSTPSGHGAQVGSAPAVPGRRDPSGRGSGSAPRWRRGRPGAVRSDSSGRPSVPGSPGRRRATVRSSDSASGPASGPVSVRGLVRGVGLGRGGRSEVLAGGCCAGVDGVAGVLGGVVAGARVAVGGGAAAVVVEEAGVGSGAVDRGLGRGLRRRPWSGPPTVPGSACVRCGCRTCRACVAGARARR